MKRNTLFYTIPLALIAALALCFVGCFTPADTEGTVTVVIGEEGNFDEYEISLSEVEITDGVLSLLIYLEENEGVELDYANSTYGAYINSIGSLSPNGLSGEFVGVYTSVEADFDVSDRIYIAFETESELIKSIIVEKQAQLESDLLATFEAPSNVEYTGTIDLDGTLINVSLQRK
jgi:hypothetical protein